MSKKTIIKRSSALLLALLMCFSLFVGSTTTAFAAAGETSQSYMVSYPRSGDANASYDGAWGIGSRSYMNGWHSAPSVMMNLHAMGSYEGQICY